VTKLDNSFYCSQENTRYDSLMKLYFYYVKLQHYNSATFGTADPAANPTGFEFTISQNSVLLEVIAFLWIVSDACDPSHAFYGVHPCDATHAFYESDSCDAGVSCRVIILIQCIIAVPWQSSWVCFFKDHSCFDLVGGRKLLRGSHGCYRITTIISWIIGAPQNRLVAGTNRAYRLIYTVQVKVLLH
jgi:hypothetical protein